MHDKTMINIMKAALNEYVTCGRISVRPTRLPNGKSYQLHVTKYRTLYDWDESGVSHGPTEGTDIVVELDLREWSDYLVARGEWKQLTREIEEACHVPQVANS